MKLIGKRYFRKLSGAAALIALAALPAPGARPANASASPVIVKMLDMPPSFDPKVVTINVGTTVEWDNVGNSVHHATDDHEMAISGGDVASPKGVPVFDSGFIRPGDKFTYVFNKPGIYKYVCVAHEASGMMGEVIVR